MKERQITKMLKLSKKFERDVYDSYTRHVLITCPMNEFKRVPYKKTMLKLINKELNPNNDEYLSFIIKNFIDKKYIQIGAK